MPLELVNETVDQAVDLDRLYDVLVTLLVRRVRGHRDATMASPA